MSGAELVGITSAGLSFLLMCVTSIVAWTFITFRTDTNARLKTLEEQNRTQALQIVALDGGAQHAAKADASLVAAVEKLDNKIEGFSKELGRFGGIIETLSRKLSGSMAIPRQP